jgi:hypothetical protein
MGLRTLPLDKTPKSPTNIQECKSEKRVTFKIKGENYVDLLFLYQN